MVKNDRWIRDTARKGMIEPFNEEQVRKGVISHGVSAYGYDMRISDTFKIFTGKAGAVIDPKNSDPSQFIDHRGETCVIPPNSFVLATSLEYFRIPRDVLVLCFGKSTYARCGVIVNVTPLEPEWEGYVTISIVNAAPCPVRIYASEGIAQCVFIGAAEVCETSYRDKAGKYQAQKEISLSKVDHVVEG